MATHSSVLAWRIPGTGEPGGLQSMGLLGKILSIIPHVVQYIIVGYVTLSSLYLPVFHSKFPLPHFSPLVIASLSSKSMNLLLLCYWERLRAAGEGGNRG